MQSVKIKAPDIQIVRSALANVGLNQSQIERYTPRTLLCLDCIENTSGGKHCEFFRAIADKIKIKTEDKTINYIRLLEKSKLLKKTMNYKKGIRCNHYKVVPKSINQCIDISDEDKDRINKAIAILSAPKRNKTLEWMNKSLKHTASGGLYFALEEIPQGWYDIPHSDIISVFLYQKLVNKWKNLNLSSMKSKEQDLENNMLMAEIKKIGNGLKDPNQRKTKAYKDILNEYDDLHREYIVFVQNTIDDVVRECEKNKVKVASDGERIWSDNIDDLRHFVSSQLLNSTQHTIAF